METNLRIRIPKDEIINFDSISPIKEPILLDHLLKDQYKKIKYIWYSLFIYNIYTVKYLI